jgi:hypothetical protein
MKRKNDNNVAEQAGKILHHLSGASENKYYFLLKESPAIIFITKVRFLWFYHWFHWGFKGVLTVIKGGLCGVLLWFDHGMFAVSRLV